MGHVKTVEKENQKEEAPSHQNKHSSVDGRCFGVCGVFVSWDDQEGLQGEGADAEAELFGGLVRVGFFEGAYWFSSGLDSILFGGLLMCLGVRRMIFDVFLN